jgi:hypothetical protein
MVLALGGQCDLPDVDAELAAFERALYAEQGITAREAVMRDGERMAIRQAIGLPAEVEG